MGRASTKIAVFYINKKSFRKIGLSDWGTSGNVGHAPMANLSTSGSRTVNSVDLPADSVAYTMTKKISSFQALFNIVSIKVSFYKGSMLNICHFNIEGMKGSKAKCLGQFCLNTQQQHNKIDILTLQKNTHRRYYR